ncbi:MAG: alanine--glyoxylate aminotransferase family protein [Vicinamibacterales bacterium]
MSNPVLSHLDPEMMRILDGVRGKLDRVFGAGESGFAFAVSGTGTSGMEAAVANVTAPGAKVLVVVTGYFGARLADIFTRYGADVSRVDVEWGRACDPQAVEHALAKRPADIVAMVHAETSTGVLNPVADVMRIAKAHGALTVVDAVTSLGAMPVATGDRDIDVCYSCSQKGLGAPSGLAPMAFSAHARASRVPSRSFYLDLSLLEDYWLQRKYHHTLSAPLMYALDEALSAVEEEGLEARYARHQRHHEALASGLEAIGLALLPPPGERLWTLNTVRVPAGVDEAAVRRELLQDFNMEIGAGLGPLAGKIWRVGLMGAGSTLSNVLLFLTALERVLAHAGHPPSASGGAAAAAEAAIAR